MTAATRRRRNAAARRAAIRRRRATALRRQRAQNVSGLTNRQANLARSRTMEAAVLGLRHSSAIHYTQGGARWQGINAHLLAHHGHYPNYADCSSFVTWCLWNGLHIPFNRSDRVNGANWRYGYTGTLLGHGKRVTGPLHRGDLAIYGNGFPGHHVAIYIGDGLVISHGSERAPLKCGLHYRPDLMQIRRYI